MSRTKIAVDLWPRGFMFEGKRVNQEYRFKCHAPVHICLPPADMELLIVEYKGTHEPFEQEAARSLEAALREWREEITADDEETRQKLDEKEDPYGETD